MPLVFLDTNPIVRYLTQDNPGQTAHWSYG